MSIVLTDDELDLGGYRFEDLQALRIVSNRTDLNRKQNEHHFPKPVKTGNSQAMFLRAEVHAWLRQRIALRDAQIQNSTPAENDAPIHRSGKVAALDFEITRCAALDKRIQRRRQAGVERRGATLRRKRSDGHRER